MTSLNGVIGGQLVNLTVSSNILKVQEYADLAALTVVDGDIVEVLDTHKLYCWTGVAWALVGTDGAPGIGVPPGGTLGQSLTKKSNSDYDTQWSAGTAPDVRGTFVVGDWVGPSIGYYTLPVTHNLSSAVIEIDIYDSGGLLVLVDWSRTSNDIVTLRVPYDPDCRFSGSYWIKTT